MSFGPVVPSAGPSPARICIVAEAPGEVESERGAPLLGPSGHELRRMLASIGVSLDACYKCNVFSRMPAGNNLALYGTSSPSPAAKALGPLTLNPITYIADEHIHELERLREELAACNPNIIIALGNTATWALLNQQGINSLRGSVHVSHFIPGREVKVVPTYHPAAVLRQWEWRTISLADLEKAHVESASPHFAYDNTEIWINPTLTDLVDFAHTHMESATICATDVETKRGQITCVSFAPQPEVAIVIPFWKDGVDPNYWPDISSESQAWRWVQHYVEKSTLTKVLQNGVYDYQYFARHGMRPKGFTEDTMLMHHSLYSELNKGLGFLGSIYANTPSWKHMRTYKLEEQLKRDD